jgi:hypothetical protein
VDERFDCTGDTTSPPGTLANTSFGAKEAGLILPLYRSILSSNRFFSSGHSVSRML